MARLSGGGGKPQPKKSRDMDDWYLLQEEKRQRFQRELEQKRKEAAQKAAAQKAAEIPLPSGDTATRNLVIDYDASDREEVRQQKPSARERTRRQSTQTDTPTTPETTTTSTPAAPESKESGVRNTVSNSSQIINEFKEALKNGDKETMYSKAEEFFRESPREAAWIPYNDQYDLILMDGQYHVFVKGKGIEASYDDLDDALDHVGWAPDPTQTSTPSPTHTPTPEPTPTPTPSPAPTGKGKAKVKIACKITLEAALDKQMKKSPKIQKNGNCVNASRDEVLQYLNPSNYDEGVYMYQFLDLSAFAGISEEDMAEYLAGKGILAGKANIYLDAARKYNVSEVYLAAHSALETGNGTSALARGVVVNGVTVYNMYGIGAYDSDPIGGGAQYAYKMGWTTPEKAIEGGAKWISEQYINNASYKQNTLYKMRWNPASPGTHQYATDIGWAVKQTSSIKKMYDNFPNASLKFDMLTYK